MLEEGAAQVAEGGDPALVAEIKFLLERIKSSTAHLDGLWEEQRTGNVQAHWWQDGELDQHRADRYGLPCNRISINFSHDCGTFWRLLPSSVQSSVIIVFEQPSFGDAA